MRAEQAGRSKQGRLKIDTLSRVQALAEAMRAVSAAANRDPSAVLDELARQAEALLGCDGASIHLAEGSGDDVAFRRIRLSDVGRTGGVPPNSTWRADAASLESLRRGETIFHEDFSGIVAPDVRRLPWLRKITSALYAPLIAGEEPLGLLVAAWLTPRRPDPELLLLGDALARCAAVAVHTARLLERAEQAHAELAAVFDAAGDAIYIFDRQGELLRVNRYGRDRMAVNFAQMPGSPQDMAEWSGAVRVEGATTRGIVGRALRGEKASGIFLYTDAAGAEQRVHVEAAPIRDQHGEVNGAVVVGRNITALHDAISESARLDGAIKTARLVAHQLNNRLSPVRGYGELLATMVEGDARMFAERIVRAADAASETVARLQRIIRFEETNSGDYPMLNLDAATATRPTADD